jgi:hypothetical protein
VRLVNIGLGEISDRLSILALKVAHGAEQAKDTTHFVTERNALLASMRSYELAGAAEWLFELAAVNAMLWHAEDEIREYRRRWPTAVDLTDLAEPTLIGMVLRAYRIQSLNDRRAELVWALNKQAGNDLGKEKLND